MPIRVHIACDDPTYREAITALLQQDDSVRVVEVGREQERGLADLEDTDPDVTVLAVPPGEDVASHTRMYLEAAGTTTRLVGFCTLDRQAEEYRGAGVETVVYGTDSADELSRAVAREARWA